MSSNEAERAAFSSRLIEAYTATGIKKIGPTTLSRDFNLRSTKPVTIHAARKWLVGEAIPAQEKLLVLANWLQVGPEWLRYGQSGRQSALPDAYAGIPERNVRALRHFGELSDENKRIVEGLLVILRKRQKSTGR